MSIAEERDGSNNSTKRFYAQGVMIGSNEFYYTRDHLGSVRELTDDTGAIEARYDYDPYGRVAKVSGSGDADFRYTGHYFHVTSGLHLAPYRTYDADLARWLSRDPIEEESSVNLYAYSDSDPVNRFDPSGLAPTDKIDGNVIRVHKNDVDPWPSKPHGHIYDKNQVVDTSGKIFNKTTGKQVGQIARKALPRLAKLFGKVGGPLSAIGLVLDALSMQQPTTNSDFTELDVPYDKCGNPLPGGKTRPVRIPRISDTNTGA